MPADAADIALSHGIRTLPARRDWRPWLGGLVSVVLLASVLYQLSRTPADLIGQIRQLRPAFWSIFIALYLAQSISELVIFKRLWGLPLASLGVLIRKNVINEIVLGYSGELYLYLWAKRHAGLKGAPFGAIKDVNILSALAGNALTLAMLALSASALQHMNLGKLFGPALWSGLGVVALSLAVVVFGRRVFTLGRPELAFITRVHVLRLVVTTALTMLLWNLALPDAPLGLWVVLVTVRLLISRLPLLTNKDLVFANLTFLFVPSQTPVATLIAALAVLTLAAHLSALAVLGALDLKRAFRR